MTEFIDVLLNIDVYLGALIASYGTLTYLILFTIIFSETGLVFAPFLPGDSLLFASGMFAAIGSFNVGFLFFLLWMASFLGDNANYWVGHFFGQKIVNNRRFPINQKYIDKTQEFYFEHGKKTIILARFIPIVRTFAPFVAGIGKMEYKKFALFSFIGGFSWVAIFVFAGFFFGNIPLVKDNFTIVTFIIIGLSILPAVWKVLKSKLQNKSNIIKSEDLNQ